MWPVRLMVVGCGLTPSFVKLSSKVTPSPATARADAVGVLCSQIKIVSEVGELPVDGAEVPIGAVGSIPSKLFWCSRGDHNINREAHRVIGQCEATPLREAGSS